MNKIKGKTMLVIHPTDRTTEMLSILYKGLGARVMESYCSNKEIGYQLRHTSLSERIMLLGHGFEQRLVLPYERWGGRL